MKKQLELKRIQGIEVRKMNEEIQSKRLSLKGKTFFFDVKKAKNESLYLAITESGMPDKDGKRKRSTIILFSEDFENFKTALNEVKLNV